MRVVNEMRFPHPVLWAGRSDYKLGSFAVILTFEERTETGALSVRYRVDLSEAGLGRLLEQRKAAIGFFITCRGTYYSVLHSISREGGALDVAPGLLRGRVVIRPIIWAVENIKDFTNPNIHPEFGQDGQQFDQGAVLALGEEIIINVGHEKLHKMESIFVFSVDDNLPNDQIRVRLEEEDIAIVATAETLQQINLLRGSKAGRAFLLNSVYLPAVMEVLSSLADDGSRFDGLRWYRVFSAKLDHFGVKPGKPGSLEAAQQLLQSPLGQIVHIGGLGT